MTTRSVVAVAALLLSILLPAGQVTSASPEAPSVRAGLAPHVPGEVLVKYRPSAAARGLRTSAVLRGHALVAELPDPGLVQLKLRAGEAVESAVAAYQEDPDVEYAQPNFIYQARKAPTDPLYPRLWGFKNRSQRITNAYTQPPNSDVPYTINNPPDVEGTPGKDINIETAWDTRTDCSSVLVAVIDSGVNYNHEDLKANMWDSKVPEIPKSGWNYVGSLDGTNDPMDYDGHGTHVAGTIGAVGENNVGVAGVCWTASIMAVKVLGPAGADDATIIKGIDFAIRNKAKVINMSLGQHNVKLDQVYADAITRALNADVAVIVAAGNDAADNDKDGDYPCNFSTTHKNVVCVAGLDQKYALYNLSNYGKASVTLGAPATNILSTWAGTTNKDVGIEGVWTSTTTTTGGGWSLTKCGAAPNQVDCLVDPASYPDGGYNKGTDDRAYNEVAVPPATYAAVKFSAAWDLAATDEWNVYFQAGPTRTDPFAGAGTKLFQSTPGMGTSGEMFPMGFDVTPCQNSNCSIGFQLKSGSTSVTAKGVRVEGLYVSSLVSNTTSYDTTNGTSMATPIVAGVVALVRAHNPLYRALDVVAAIKASGTATPSLANITETGKAVDAMRAIAFILPPTGVTATVQ